MRGEHSYAEAGVDIESDDQAIASIGKWIERTYSFREENTFPEVKGHYSGLYRLDDERVLAISTDGVGTKLIVARMMFKFDTVGIDLMGMLANDIISVGSTPVAMVDYIGARKPEPELLSEIGKGLYEGCKRAHVVALGGETATMPDLIDDVDLVGAIVGICDEEQLVLGSGIREGDVLVGIKSSGMHSNGYTLARKVFFTWNDFSIHDQLPTDESMSIGEALMVPTTIYVDVILEILRNLKPHGLAHITGGGLTKLNRLKSGMGYAIDRIFPTHPVFEAVRKLGKVSWPEMYRTYNMGVGFVVIVPPESTEQVVEICEDNDLEAKPIGTAIPDPDQRIRIKAQEKFVL